MTARYQRLTSELAPLHEALVNHGVYGRLADEGRLRAFMAIHVFAVWDFMSLLKTLQQRLTCTSVPWTPPKNRLAARLVNEIVLGEESDEIAPGVFSSHFELYLAAMAEVGASTSAIESLMGALGSGLPVRDALGSVPLAARDFVRTTFSLAEGETPAVAAAFLVGRERLVPRMFSTMLGVVDHAPLLRSYLERHVTLDGDVHGPMAERLLESLCGESDDQWAVARGAAERSLRARIRMWDAVDA